jgi:hypothetical protein
MKTNWAAAAMTIEEAKTAGLILIDALNGGACPDTYNDRSSVPKPQAPDATALTLGPQAIEHQGSEEQALLYCPACSTRLESRKCKLFCALCGYYLSCADYY